MNLKVLSKEISSEYTTLALAQKEKGKMVGRLYHMCSSSYRSKLESRLVEKKCKLLNEFTTQGSSGCNFSAATVSKFAKSRCSVIFDNCVCPHHDQADIKEKHKKVNESFHVLEAKVKRMANFESAISSGKGIGDFVNDRAFMHEITTPFSEATKVPTVPNRPQSPSLLERGKKLVFGTPSETKPVDNHQKSYLEEICADIAAQSKEAAPSKKGRSDIGDRFASLVLAIGQRSKGSTMSDVDKKAIEQVLKSAIHSKDMSGNQLHSFIQKVKTLNSTLYKGVMYDICKKDIPSSRSDFQEYMKHL